MESVRGSFRFQRWMDMASRNHQLYQNSAEVLHCEVATLSKVLVCVQVLPSAFPHGTESSRYGTFVPVVQTMGIVVVNLTVLP